MTVVFQMLGASFIFVMGLMILLLIIYAFQKNAGIVDIGWALGYVICAWTYFSLGDGDLLRRALIAILVSIWGLRLAYYLINRFLRTDEDKRYQKIRKKWGSKFFLMFILQGLLVIILSIPFLIISVNEREWSSLEGIGVLVWLGGMTGEVFADLQLERFKEEHPGKVCDQGLWKWSRHPNYFFEWVIWIGYFLIALPAAGGWIAVVSPLIMLYLLTQVSGIPMAEAEALETKGDAYRDYQQRTSSFLPWFPKRS